MASSGEKAAQLVKNNRLFIAIWENTKIPEKIINVENYLKLGADVNTHNANFKNNTPLHIAVKKAEVDIIKLLLERGADVNSINSLDETPLDIANTLKSDAKDEIIALLENHRVTNKSNPKDYAESEMVEEELSQRVEEIGPKVFQMQDRNTGVRGHLYETKSLSLVLLRAANDKDIEDYYLASNMSGIGVFDDICFKYNVKGRNKSIRLFLQAKHRELPKKGRLTVEDVMKPDGDLGLASCFDSFLQIKKKLDPKKADPIFGESYENVELNFIIYTSAEESFQQKLIGRNERSPKIHYLIYTGGKKAIFQFDYKDNDIDRITTDVQRMRIKQLAQNFIDFILGDKDKYKHMMEDDLIKKYHCVLAQKAVQNYSVENNYINAKFRPELLFATDPLTVLLKEELCKVMIEKCCTKATKVNVGIVKIFTQLPKEPSSDALSQFIGTVITYDVKNNRLKVLENVSKRGLKSNDIKLLNEHLKQIHANPTVIRDAIIRAGEQKLMSAEFKLPPSFGNRDMTIKDVKIAHMVSIFKDLFEINRNSGVITINESDLGKNVKQDTKSTLNEGFLGHNGGIGGAIGNLLLYDENTQILKFNTARPQFEKAYALLEKLEKVVPEGKKLEEYVVKVNTYNFPRASFSNDEYDSTMAKNFLNRLWFYTNQGKEDEVEKCVKEEIEKYYNEYRGRKPLGFRTHVDSIFSTFHYELQKWWMVSTVDSFARYLTSEDEIFRKAQEGVVESPLLTLHSQMYVDTLKRTGIEFILESVNSLQLDEFPEKFLNIKTDCETLTAIKIHQHYKTKNNYNFINFSYMLSLPLEDRNAILEEVNLTSTEILIITYGVSEPEKPVHEDLNRIINGFKGRKIIIVTMDCENLNVNLLLAENFKSVKDQMNDFIHFAEHSQNKFPEEITVKFQDEEVTLKDLLDDTFKRKINAKILSSLMTNDRIEIGQLLMNKNYEDIKDFYVPRRLIKEDSDELYPVNSLEDMDDSVVLIITKHGTGKSTLFTHIALESKKVNPTRWIVRTNLAGYVNDSHAWQTEVTKINKANALKLLCTKSLTHIIRKATFQLAERNGKIVLDSYDGLDGIALLELELFLHYYNEGKMTFLFYGFDYICPPFGREAAGLLKKVKSDNIPMWIASHAVGEPMKVLVKMFGTPYTLQTIDETAQSGFFYKFWKTNVQMEKINNELCSTISNIFESLLDDPDPKRDRIIMPWITLPLHMLYLFSTKFLKTELCNLSFENVKRKLKPNVAAELNKVNIGAYIDETPTSKEAAELAGTPLFMYVAANYFACKINGGLKIQADFSEIRIRRDIWIDALELYESFLMHNMNKVYCQSDTSHLDIGIEADKRKEFFKRHKKLALLAICKEKDLCKLLPAEEIKELKDTIKRIQTGEEKSALVECVLDNVPKFFHLMYAEHCAVELLIDILKVSRDESNDVRIHNIWDFIVNILLYSCSNSVRSAFDYKLKSDPGVAELTAGQHCRNTVFELIMKQNIEGATGSDRPNCLKTAVECGMNNLVKLLLKSIETNLTEKNKGLFMKFMATIDIFSLTINLMGGKTPTNFTQFFTDMRLDKVADVLKSEHTVALPMAMLSLFVDKDVVDQTRRSLDRARKRLVDKAAENFGLSAENVELFQRLAEMLKNSEDNRED